MSTRRTFIKQLSLTTGLLAAPRLFAHDPLPWETSQEHEAVRRLRGRVRCAAAGVAGAVISDGLSSVRCDSDGYFELISRAERPFAFLGLPAGYAIPTASCGTSRLFRPLAGAGDDIEMLFELDRLEEDDSEHSFLVLADPQILDREDAERMHAETVPDIIETVQGLGNRHLFGVSCGDIVYDHLNLYPEYERAVSRSGVPFFQVVGNHDVDQGVGDFESVRTFGRHFGPNYYSFDRGEIHYVVLDDVYTTDGYIGQVDEVQLAWLKSDLALVEKGRPVVVFVHIPPYNEVHLRMGYDAPNEAEVVVNRERLYEILAPWQTTFICGHMHENEYLHDGGCDIHICGAACGAWWTGDICGDGSPNGYSIYTARGSDLQGRYKGVGCPDDYRAELIPGKTPILNVWEATDKWKIVWHEDGEARGPMERFTGMDPRAVARLEGETKPRKHTWAEPLMTNHLFRANPAEGWRELTCVVTPPQGKDILLTTKNNFE